MVGITIIIILIYHKYLLNFNLYIPIVIYYIFEVLLVFLILFYFYIIYIEIIYQTIFNLNSYSNLIYQ